MRYRLLPVLSLFLLLLACSASAPRPESAPGAPAPQAAVERFLQLVQERDYVGLGWVFGTREGPIIERDPVAEVERRMYALANLLTHEHYELGDQAPVPGSIGESYRFDVTIRQRGRRHEVPFTVVRGPDGQWFVEKIGVEAITQLP